jgi:micrococcal nuclease
MRNKTGQQWVALVGVVVTALVSAWYVPRPQPKPQLPPKPATPASTVGAASGNGSHKETHGTAKEAPPSGQTYRVVRVADGDTLELAAADGAPFRVRLQGVDCPELSQPYGDEALRFTISHVRGHQVHLTGLGTDQFGRVLGVVEVNGENLNHTLVGAGYAWCFRRYAEDPELPKLEAAARQARRGLWAQAKPEPPWEYRQQHGGRK